MERPIEHIIDILVAILVLFLFPIIYFGLKQDALVQTLVQTKTEEFVHEIRSNGYLSKQMYEDYIRELSATGLLYDITLEHSHYSYEPEYRFRSKEEVIEEQDNAYTGENKYTYRPVNTDIPHVEDPIDNSGNLNTETNESILAGAVRTPPSSTHVHTDACYQGTKHKHTGSPSSGGGCYGKSDSSECTALVDFLPSRLTDERQFTCNRIIDIIPGEGSSLDYVHCKGTQTYIHWSGEGECSNGHYHHGTFYYSYTCDTCGYDDTYVFGDYGEVSPFECGVKDTSYRLNCGKEEGAYYDANGNKVSTVCSEIIASISPTNPVQTVYTNDPLITTIKVIYNDGSSYILKANTTFSTASVVQNQTATLTYVNVVGSYSKTHTCNITVTVIPRNKKCTHGHTYNLNSDGTDPGCPFCRAYLSKLEVAVPSSGKIEIFKGTSLESNGVTLLATYMDGRKEYLTTGYAHNLDTNYVGTQTVTLSYKGKNTTLTVITKRNLTKCSICNLFYELYPDGSDPGCPYCAAKTPIFTGNILEYDNRMYEADILKKLYEEDGIYKFSIDDYIEVSVTNRSRGMGHGVLGAIIKGINSDFIHVREGGYIREEKRS